MTLLDLARERVAYLTAGNGVGWCRRVLARRDVDRVCLDHAHGLERADGAPGPAKEEAYAACFKRALQDVVERSNRARFPHPTL